MFEFTYNEECNSSSLRTDGTLYVIDWRIGYVGIIVGRYNLTGYERVF